jgi:hypothetical protein
MGCKIFSAMKNRIFVREKRVDKNLALENLTDEDSKVLLCQEKSLNNAVYNCLKYFEW